MSWLVRQIIGVVFFIHCNFCFVSFNSKYEKVHVATYLVMIYFKQLSLMMKCEIHQKRSFLVQLPEVIDIKDKIVYFVLCPNGLSEFIMKMDPKNRYKYSTFE